MPAKEPKDEAQHAGKPKAKAVLDEEPIYEAKPKVAPKAEATPALQPTEAAEPEEASKAEALPAEASMNEDALLGNSLALPGSLNVLGHPFTCVCIQCWSSFSVAHCGKVIDGLYHLCSECEASEVFLARTIRSTDKTELTRRDNEQSEGMTVDEFDARYCLLYRMLELHKADELARCMTEADWLQDVTPFWKYVRRFACVDEGYEWTSKLVNEYVQLIHDTPDDIIEDHSVEELTKIVFSRVIGEART